MTFIQATSTKVKVLILFLLLVFGSVIWFWPWLTPINKPQIAGSYAAESALGLIEVADGFSSPTDIQFVPKQPDWMLVLEKSGSLVAYYLPEENDRWNRRKTILQLDVLTGSEQGLLGMAFHPHYPQIPCFYLNSIEAVKNHAYTKIGEWCGQTGQPFIQQQFKHTRTIFQTPQPYSNHNAGQILFGPDGYFYIPLGDGGAGGDPHGHGQNLQTFLGSILRIDITAPGSERPYHIPPDNPFVHDEKAKGEIFAYGLRNPWRASFDPQGRLIVSDVGQNLWEEISIIRRAGNYGWNHREGLHCFPPAKPCRSGDYVEPVHEYGHDQGRSITGGYVWLSADFPVLMNQYLFADFVSGRIWALDLASGQVTLLGKWPMLPSTFGRDPEGNIYVADYLRGSIYRFGEILED